MNTVVGAQQLLLAKEEDGAAKKSKPPEDNKFCHEQVKGNVMMSVHSRSVSNDPSLQQRRCAVGAAVPAAL